MNKSHIYQPTQVVWIFHQVVSSLVLKTVGIMCQGHRVFKASDDSDRNLSQFFELRVFLKCDQFLVSWPCGIEPELT
jgi:hypothetical protein